MSAFWIFATCLTVAYIIDFEAEKRRNWPSAEKEKNNPEKRGFRTNKYRF